MATILTQSPLPAQAKASLRQRAAAAYQARLAAERRDEARLLVATVAEVLGETVTESDVDWLIVASDEVVPVVRVGLDQFSARWSYERAKGELIYLPTCPACATVYEIRIPHLADLGEALAGDARCAACAERERAEEEERW